MNYLFLPEIQTKKLKKEYILKVIVVFLLLLSAVNIIGIVALFPSFIISKTLYDIELSKIAEIDKRNNIDGIDAIKKEFTKDNLFLKNTKQIDLMPEFYPYIKDIISVKGSNKLSSIAVTGVSTSSINFVIQGFSPNRDELLAYKNRIMTSFAGSNVDLPISVLAKNKDIQFSLNITLKI